MSYENFLIREQNGDYQRGDTNCSDCGQLICACESLSEWMDEVNSGGEACVPPPSEIHSFSDWLESHGDSLPLPESFTEWLEQKQQHNRSTHR